MEVKTAYLVKFNPRVVTLSTSPSVKFGIIYQVLISPQHYTRIHERVNEDKKIGHLKLAYVIDSKGKMSELISIGRPWEVEADLVLWESENLDTDS